MNKYERFFEKVNITGRKRSDCWEWIGTINARGYGDFSDGQRNMVAHRFLIEPIPEGKEACHRCDNRRCVRPSHIFIGTRSDNMQDCIAKGRLRPINGLLAAINSRRNCKRKLSDDEIREIRSKTNHTLKNGAQKHMCERYGVSKGVISEIVSYKTYRDVV